MIDDSPPFNQLIQDILDESLCNLTATTDPHEGLRLALTGQNWDLIILDIFMPELSGLEILEELRHAHTRTIPVMMFTANAHIKAVEKALELGIAAYLLKPFHIKDFIEHLNQILKLDIFAGEGKQKNWSQELSNTPFVQPDVPQLYTKKVLYFEPHVSASGSQLFQALLAGSTCQVKLCRKAEEAFAYWQDHHPELIILGIESEADPCFMFYQNLRIEDKRIKVLASVRQPSYQLRRKLQDLDLEILCQPYSHQDLYQHLEATLVCKLFV